MTIKLSEAQQALLLDVAEYGSAAHGHPATWRVLQQHGWVTLDRRLTAAGRREVAKVRRTARSKAQEEAILREILADMDLSLVRSPPPPPPTPEQVAQREAEEAWLADQEALHALFWPRPTWCTPLLSQSSEQELEAVVLLGLMRARGLVHLEQQVVPINRCWASRWLEQRDLRRWERVATEQDRDILERCRWRRGQDELKDMSWTAYRVLRRGGPDDDITFLPNIPFAVHSVERQAAIVAGNLAVRRSLEAIAEWGLLRYGIVGYPEQDLDEQGYLRGPPRPNWQVTWLVFTAAGLERLRHCLG